MYFHFKRCIFISRSFVIYFKLINYWLRWVFTAACELSLVVAAGMLSREVPCSSLWWLSLLWSTGARARRRQYLQLRGSVVVAHGLSCPIARGIFSDKGSNLCLLRWQADS